MDRDITYRKDIVDAIEQIENYTTNVSHEEFIKTPLVHDAVIRQLQIIGEASKRLSMQFKTVISQAPWKKIAGTRDVLIHDYGTVDIEMVWKIVKDDLPKLKSALQK